MKTRAGLTERRRHIRLQAPIGITYTTLEDGFLHEAIIKNISADGLGFEALDKAIKESGVIELKLNIPAAVNPVHAKGRVIWKRRLSLEDNAPFDVGVEFTEIEEDNKNTFLKFLCDLIYNLPEDGKHANKKP